ncbi:MAG: putative toxin-antitoxin system toxin component, PIN family [Acidobacteria bacterium]|nr:putative toxin-antitoxin system toxin component, PIN family [Acidobacteriota bacterium]
MTVVLDTNIVTSATYWRGKPAHCLEAWVLGKYDLAISHPILSEYEEVVARLATRYPGKQPTDWLSAIRQAGHLYLPVPLTASTADPDDEMFIECAVAARADYLVTGDKGHLLTLKQVSGIPIVVASDFLRLLGLPENPT